MRSVGRVLVVLAAVLVSAAAAPAQPPGEEPGRRPPGPDVRPPQPGRLIPPFVEERLRLTDDQRKQIDELQKDVDAKREAAQVKLNKILTAEQRRILREVRERGGRPGFGGPPDGRPGLPGGRPDAPPDRPGRRPEAPPGAPDRPGRRPEAPPGAPERRPGDGDRPPGPPGGRPGFEGGPPRPGLILPPFVQTRLNLTAEQKKQLEQLQKDVDARLARILTEEQRAQLREMRGPGGRPGRPGGPPGERPRGDRPPDERPRRDERPPRPAEPPPAR